MHPLRVLEQFVKHGGPKRVRRKRMRLLVGLESGRQWEKIFSLYPAASSAEVHLRRLALSL